MKERNNEAFLYSVSDMTAGELKSAYLWMCRQLGLLPRKSLLKTRTNRDRIESWYRLIHRRPSHHAVGNALFSIYETLKGREIYKHMIHGDFRFE